LKFRIGGTGTCRKGVWMQVAGVLMPQKTAINLRKPFHRKGRGGRQEERNS
jgi:hypothetical protein